MYTITTLLQQNNLLFMIHKKKTKKIGNTILYMSVDELGMSYVNETEVKHHCTYSIITQTQ